MAVQTLNTLKGWFETGDKPTQAQFADLLDSCHNGAITIAQVIDLVAALAGKVDKTVYDAFEQGQLILADGPYTYVIPAGYELEKIIAFYGDAGAMQISTVAMGATDEADIEELLAGWNRSITLNILAVANTNLYLDGIPAGSKIVFIKRKIKMV